MKLIASGGVAQASLLAVATSADENFNLGPWVAAVREFGSFGIIILIFLGLGWLLKKYVPVILEQQEKRYNAFLTELAMTRTTYDASLAAERQLREHSMAAFREMLSAHKADQGSKLVDVRSAVDAGMEKLSDGIEEGNRITQTLVNELKARPCQIKH